jgi:c-di-GMP-binding flagellar brake protein YcgR
MALEVMARRLRNDALRGDAQAIKLSIELMRRHSETRETAVRFDELQAQDREILAQYLFGSETAKKGDGDDPDGAI